MKCTCVWACVWVSVGAKRRHRMPWSPVATLTLASRTVRKKFISVTLVTQSVIATKDFIGSQENSLVRA